MAGLWARPASFISSISFKEIILVMKHPEEVGRSLPQTLSPRANLSAIYRVFITAAALISAKYWLIQINDRKLICIYLKRRIIVFCEAIIMDEENAGSL